MSGSVADFGIAILGGPVGQGATGSGVALTLTMSAIADGTTALDIDEANSLISDAVDPPAGIPGTVFNDGEVVVGSVQVVVPDVVGLEQGAAEAAIVAANLAVGTVTSENSSTVPAGDVIRHDPVAGTSVAEGTAVDLLVSLGVAGPTVLFKDEFSPAGATVGTPTVGSFDWVELENSAVGTSVSINGAEKLFFEDAADAVNRPLVRNTFAGPASGTLGWSFDFDWTRTGPEGTYRVLMQLGGNAGMSDGSQDGGVGVNLIWTGIDGTHQSLGYRDSGGDHFLEVMSGAKHISVVADLSSQTYSVQVDDGAVHSGISFHHSVSLNQVRFFTDALNEDNFSGRTFDNVEIGG